MRQAAKDVATYLSLLPNDSRAALERLRKLVKSAAPDATESISYGMPMFKQNGQLVAYAAFKNHCSFFVCSATFLNKYKADLKSFTVSGGTIHFTPDKPLPAALVKKLVKARLAENMAKKR